METDRYKQIPIFFSLSKVWLQLFLLVFFGSSAKEKFSEHPHFGFDFFNFSESIKNSLAPVVNVSNAAFLQFEYAEGQGPSIYQTFQVSGSGLLGNIVINVPANWEISTNATFNAPTAPNTYQQIVLNRNASNNVSSTNIHLRLKAGLLQGTYQNMNGLEVNSTGISTQTKDLNGLVTPPVPFINVEGNLGTFPDITAFTNSPMPTNNTLWGSRPVYTSETKSFRIQNLGGAPLALSSIVIVGDHPSDFVVSSIVPPTLASGSTIVFNVTFTPTNHGVRNAVVRIVNNSSNISPNFDFNISGTGSNAEIDVNGNSIQISSGSSIVNVSNYTIIGSANSNATNSTVVSKNFIISNLGNVVLEISSVTVVGADADQFVVSPTSHSIPAGETSVLSVTFVPTSAGVKNATVRIDNNDLTGSESSYTFAVQGNGVDYVRCEPGSVGTLQVLAVQDFEPTPSPPSWSFVSTGGVIQGGMATAVVNGSNASKEKFIGSSSYQVSQATGVLDFSFDTSNYQDLELHFRLGAFSSTSGNGVDAGDFVKVSISSDGVNYVDELLVKGVSDNRRWSFEASGIVAKTSNYRLQEFPSETGNIGLTFISLSNLPASATFRVKITAYNDGANEIWAVDNVTLRGKLKTGIAQKTWNGTAWSGDGNPPTVSQKAVFSGGYNSALNGGNVTGCECDVASGVVLDFASGSVIDIQSDIVNNGIIRFEDSASLVQRNDNAVNSGTGTIEMKRTTTPMYRYDFTYWSSPVEESPSFTLNTLSPGTLPDKYFRWNTLAQNWQTVMNGNSPMDEGIGYIVRAPQNYPIEGQMGATPQPYHATFIGKPNNGLIAVNVVGGSDQWNLIGNPYPSAIDANEFILHPGNENLDGTLYFWTHNSPPSASNSGSATYNYSSDDYASYNLTGATATALAAESGSDDPLTNNSNAPNGSIPAGQSFFVLGDANGNAVFSNTMRITGPNSNFYRQPHNTAEGRVWLNLINGTRFHQMLIGYIDQATDGKDRGFDGILLGGSSANISTLIGTEKFTIQGRGLPFNIADEVPLSVSFTTSGTYKIAIDHFDGFFNTQDIFLKDNSLNVIHNLKTAPYEFTATTGSSNNRFVLVYRNTSLDQPEFNLARNQVYVLNRSEKLLVKSMEENLKTVEVYDLLGREIYRATDIQSKEQVIDGNLAIGQALIIRIELENCATITTKAVFVK